MSTKLTKKAKILFESIRHLDSEGQEYWSSRELSRVLEYSDYKYFEEVARRAYIACRNSGINPDDHFVVKDEMVKIGSGAERKIVTVFMSRYACYLAMQNASSAKPIVAQAQTYFAIQVRRAELLLDNKMALTEEEERRLLLRDEMRRHNTQLAGAAKDSGVKTPLDYAVFQKEGYKGLYGGLDRKDIHQRKGLKKSQDILDHMGSTELAANLFRATQTEDVLRKNGIKGKVRANRIHKEIGAKVRKTIKDIGGTMPENLPTPESIKRLESKQKRIAAQEDSTSES